MKLTDNGKGFDTHITSPGNGLENMYSRARSIGGVLKIDSTIGQGTTIMFEGNIY
jgi:signal transduction histidine kinase